MEVPKRAVVSQTILDLIKKAIDIFLESAQPVAKITEISPADFDDLYRGENQNAKDTPLQHIYPKAHALALYTTTLGSAISHEIEKLLQSNDLALGAILDATASVGADNGTQELENIFLSRVSNRKSEPGVVLGYSPGYCGWHISGQKQLFNYLNPEEIGVTLNRNCLMTPIKSVSGVLVAGNKEIHYFKPDWDFCEVCKTHSCLMRMKDLKMH